MADTIVDTSVLVDYLRKLPDARACLAALRRDGPIRTHIAVVAELQAGVRDRGEAREAARLVAACELVLPDQFDLRRSVALQERFHLSHRIEWIDCLIAATAIRLKCEVVTRNDRHFRLISGLRVVRPY